MNGYLFVNADRHKAFSGPSANCDNFPIAVSDRGKGRDGKRSKKGAGSGGCVIFVYRQRFTEIHPVNVYNLQNRNMALKRGKLPKYGRYTSESYCICG